MVTGEGSFDAQSLHGKVLSGVAGVARQAQARLAVLAGSVGVSPEEYGALGVTHALALRGPGMSVEEAVARSRELLEERTRELIRRM